MTTEQQINRGMKLTEAIFYLSLTCFLRFKLSPFMLVGSLCAGRSNKSTNQRKKDFWYFSSRKSTRKINFTSEDRKKIEDLRFLICRFLIFSDAPDVFSNKLSFTTTAAARAGRPAPG